MNKKYAVMSNGAGRWDVIARKADGHGGMYYTTMATASSIQDAQTIANGLNDLDVIRAEAS